MTFKNEKTAFEFTQFFCYLGYSELGELSPKIDANSPYP